MKNVFRSIFVVLTLLLLLGSTSFANMKKGSVGAGGQKTFVFSTGEDGPCSVTVIYDSNTADLDTGIGVVDTGDVLCFGLSTQRNYDACTAGLPPGDYFFVVSSFKGSSAFRTVVNCGSQESISGARQSSTGVEVREIEGNSKTRKFIEQMRKVSSTKN